MDVIPAIRAALSRDSAEQSGSSVAALRDLSYADYLQTPHWRRVRDAALRTAGHRCHRCQTKADLQVHHVSYERLGAEWASDLEVLCRACHEGHHHDESRRLHLGIYVKLASDALRATPYTAFADLVAAVESLCRRHGVSLHRPRIVRAVEAVTTNRVALIRPRTDLPALAATHESSPPLTRQEASQILRSLGIVVGLRAIPGPARGEIDIYATVSRGDEVEHDRY